MFRIKWLLVVYLFSAGVRCHAQDGKWTKIKAVTNGENCSECGMAVIDGKLYLAGGDGGSLTLQQFDPVTLKWINKTSLPVSMHHFQAVGYKGHLYVLDAFTQGGFPNQAPMANVYIYSAADDSWKKGAPISEGRRRAAAGAAEYEGKIYLVAGISHGHSSGTTNLFDVYDPKLDQMTSLADAPHIRDHCSAAVIGDKLYVAGGRNTSYHEPDNFMAFMSHTVSEVDVYDFKTEKWSTLASRLPLGSGGGALVNLNNILYYMGGERATATERNAPRKNTFFLDPLKDDGWKETDSLHLARNGMAAAVLNNRIYVAGGSGGGPGGPPPSRPGLPQGNAMPPASNEPHPAAQRNNDLAVEVFILNTTR